MCLFLISCFYETFADVFVSSQLTDILLTAKVKNTGDDPINGILFATEQGMKDSVIGNLTGHTFSSFSLLASVEYFPFKKPFFLDFV